MSVPQMLIVMYHLVAESNDIDEFQKFLDCSSIGEQLSILLNHMQMNKKRKDYRELEKQLQKYEQEVRTHIRESYLMNQKFDEMKMKIKQLEDDRDQLLNNTKLTLSKLKKENEHLYQNVKKLQDELQLYKQLELTQQSTKISYSKSQEKSYEKSKKKHKNLYTSTTPLKSTNSSFDYLANKRFSLQNALKKQKILNSFLLKKRRSCHTDLSKSN